MNVHRYYLTSSANIALIQSWSIKQLVATNKRARARCCSCSILVRRAPHGFSTQN